MHDKPIVDKMFVKMCDCDEIQSKWEPAVGDVIYHRDSKQIEANPLRKEHISWSKNEYDLIPMAVTWPDRRTRYIWLPSQAQLQGMVGGDNYQLVEKFATWALSSERCSNRDWIMNTMEELWLVFVLQAKHNKIWNGDTWINR